MTKSGYNKDIQRLSYKLKHCVEKIWINPYGYKGSLSLTGFCEINMEWIANIRNAIVQYSFHTTSGVAFLWINYRICGDIMDAICVSRSLLQHQQ